MSLILLAGIFYLIYCLLISLIAWGVFETGRACSDLAGYYAGAIAAGFFAVVITIIALPSEGPNNTMNNSYRKQAYNCADSTMTPSRQQSMNEFIKYCGHDRGVDIGTCTEKAQSLYCTPIKEVPKPEPVIVTPI